MPFHLTPGPAVTVAIPWKLGFTAEHLPSDPKAYQLVEVGGETAERCQYIGIATIRMPLFPGICFIFFKDRATDRLYAQGQPPDISGINKNKPEGLTGPVGTDRMLIIQGTHESQSTGHKGEKPMADETVEKAEKKAKKPAEPPAEKQHGVTKPKAGTKTGRIWEISDQISTRLGQPAPRKQVLEAAVAESINPATAATQYGRWRVFHGLGKEPGSAKPAAESADVKTETAPT